MTGTPKSGIGRSVPMPAEVAAALKEVRARKMRTQRSDPVFVGRALGHVDLDALHARFNAAQDAAGVPLRTIQEWMGHESITTTERYASHMPRERDEAIVSAAFAVTAGGQKPEQLSKLFRLST